MGKKKNKNKISGAVKTAIKTEKKLANKLKKKINEIGEVDIQKVVADIELEEAKRATASEKTLSSHPSPRAYASLTPHPTNNELILFGGEHHDGKETIVFNELLIYRVESDTWRQIKAPGAPPPRSGHQAIATSANRGELWVFGGEFTSPNETQFYHYKDLWCFSLADKKWEKVMAPKGPSARSGHRMVLLGRDIYLFGGYNDNGKHCVYYDDLYNFNLDTRSWSKVVPKGRAPSPRSACVMLPAGSDSIVIYGGFTRSTDGRGSRAVCLSDAYRAERRGGEWAWRALAPPPGPPLSARAAAAHGHANTAYMFGGVQDSEETEEQLIGEMSGELQIVDLETGRWREVMLRGTRAEARSKLVETKAEEKKVEGNDVTVVTDEVFTMRLGPSSEVQETPSSEGKREPDPTKLQGPSPRMSTQMAVQRSILYIMGGVVEKGDKQFYLEDMYSLDLHKLDRWKTLIEQPPLPDWLDSDSEDESGSDTDSENSGSESEE